MKYKYLTIIFLVFIFICLPVSSATELADINNYQTVDNKPIENVENTDNSLGKNYPNETNETDDPFITIIEPDLGEYLPENNTNNTTENNNNTNNDTPNNNTNNTDPSKWDKFVKYFGQAGTILGVFGGTAGLVAFIRSFKTLTGYIRYAFSGKKQLTVLGPISDASKHAMISNGHGDYRRYLEEQIFEFSPDMGDCQGCCGLFHCSPVRTVESDIEPCGAVRKWKEAKQRFTAWWNSCNCPFSSRRVYNSYGKISSSVRGLGNSLLPERVLTREPTIRVYRKCDGQEITDCFWGIEYTLVRDGFIKE